MHVVAVLRSSELYDVDYVERLYEGVEQYLPGTDFVCLSDTAVPGKHIPLMFDWPGWWAKMEIFRPDITGDILYFDLDTILVKNCGFMNGHPNRPAMLADFYRPGGLGSGVMWLPEASRSHIWKSWTRNPSKWMKLYQREGDQAFLEQHWISSADRLQQLFPGKIVSYKAHHVGISGVPQGAAVVCFHGKPKPRDVGWRVGE